MAKKREMSDAEYNTYHRIHEYENPLDEERGKVRRERANYARYRHQRDAHLKRRLRDVIRAGDTDLDDDAIIDAELDARAQRELRNARAHKDRLQRLERYEAQTDQGDPPDES